MNDNATGRALLSIQGVAARLDVPAATIRKWRTAGHGPPGVRIGRHVRYRPADVEAWINGQFEPPVLPPGALPPEHAPAEARYFPWPDLAEEIATAVAEVFSPTPTEVNTINNAVWDALPDAYRAYMRTLGSGATHEDAHADSMRELRAALAQHLRPLRKSRSEHPSAAAGSVEEAG